MKPIRLAVLALGCLLISLIIPSIQIQIMGHPATFLGWQATASAMGLFLESAAKATNVVIGSAALGNMLFVAVPLVMAGRANISALRALFIFAAFAFAAALAAPFTLDIKLRLLIGYYVWLLGHTLQLIAIILHMRAMTRP